MYNLTDEKLKQVSGGGITVAGWTAIGAALVFVVGVIDGYIRPYKCR
jgi:lactobin A/cerein 7B family class IIb bacteriocin